MYGFGSGHPDETGATPHDKGWGHGRAHRQPEYHGADHRSSWRDAEVDRGHSQPHEGVLIAALTAKYGTIGALNAAWNTGGYYTTFRSAGGWGVGTRLTDEDGFRPRP
jgi:hypothetical protein